MLAAMLTPFTTRSVIMELNESCIPMNHPLKAIRPSVAGAAQTRMKKYLSASPLTSEELSTRRKASFVKGHCINRMRAAQPSASSTARIRMRAHSRRSPRPKAWAVNPPVPTLRNAKFQYSRSKSMEPMDMPPMNAAAVNNSLPCRCPATAMSTIPTMGTVILARMLGMARRRISLLSAFMRWTNGISCPPRACRDRSCSARR